MAVFGGVVISEAYPSKRVKSEELHVFRDRIVLFLKYEVSEPRFTTDLRERFDRDADRRLATGEREELAAYAQILATEDLFLEWDGQRLTPTVTLRATSGLDRVLPSAYPLVFYWLLEFEIPESAQLVRVGERHELSFSDREARSRSAFECRVRLVPGVEIEQELEGRVDAADTEYPRNFAFSNGGGFFKIGLSFRSRNEP